MNNIANLSRESVTTLLLWVLTACIAVWAISPGPAISADTAQAPNQVTVTAAGGRLRNSPSLDGDIAAQLKQDAQVSVHAIKGDWFLIESSEGGKGWAHRSLFTQSDQTATKESATALDPSPKTTGSGDETSPPVPDTAAKTETAQDSSTPETRASGEQGPDIVFQSSTSNQITLNFVDIDVRELLSALAINQEINIVMASDVAGRVSIHLYQASLAKVLKAITLAGGLGYRKRNDVYYVYKPEEKKDPQAQWLQLRTFKLNYIDTDKLQDIIKAVPDIRMIEFHEATKTIVVEDTPENIQRIEALIRRLDAKPRQVMIVAKILEIRLNEDMAMGVNWEALLNKVSLGAGGFSRAILPTAETGPVSAVPATGAGIFGNFITGIGTAHQFALAVDALKAKTSVNVLSTPKLLALHGKSASVQVGGQQGYKVTTTNLGVVSETIKFIDTGTILHITPYIDEEDNILLNVRPTISSATLDEGIPVVNRTIVSTWLLVKNNETVFIGGLIQDTKFDERSEIPGLGQLPIIGPLFGRTSEGIGKTELVVMIAPRIFGTALQQRSKRIEKRIEKIERNLKKEQSVFQTEEGLLEPPI